MKRFYTFALIGVVSALPFSSGHAQSGKTEKKVTYADLQPLFRDKCMACHRPGEIAPMSLLTYEETRPWAKSIRKEVKRRAMPPWDADRQHSVFRNDISLTDDEIQKIMTWVDTGAERGNPAAIAPPPAFLEGWQVSNVLGRQPDVVLYMQEEYTIPAGGEDINKDFEIPTNFKRDYWVIASEVRGNPRVVHHNTTTVRGPDGSRDRTGRLSSAVPGKLFDLFGPESAKLIRAGSTIVFGMHYHPYGKEEKDRSKIGLWLAKKPFDYRVHSSVVADQALRIPPRDGNFYSGGEYVFDEDSEVTAMKPHMHWRGKDMEYKVVFPDGREQILLSVPAYDFNWQINYELKEPVFVPKGSKMVVNAHFDNSETNPWNPDPEVEVMWGSDSRDEMMEGWFDFRRKMSERVDPKELVLTPNEFDAIKAPTDTGSK